MSAAVRRPGDKRQWEAWAVISPEDEIYRVEKRDPNDWAPFRGLRQLGWTCTKVTITEK